MLITPLPQIRTEDFPKEHQMWLEKLLRPLNQFLSSTTTALNGQLTVTNNLLAQRKPLTFTYGTTTLPLTLSTTLSNPQSVRVISATENGTQIALIPTWQVASQGQLTLTALHKVANGAVSSLVAGAAYVLNLQIEA